MWDQVKEALDSVELRVATHLRDSCEALDLAGIDLDHADVVLGLLARQYQLWCVLLIGPSSWTGPVYPVLLRALTDGLITISWIAGHPESAERYKLYSAGRLKLLAAHWREAGGADAESWQKEYAESLEELASSERWLAALPVELSNWSGKDMRTMAQEAGLKAVYDLSYSPLSAEAHGEWMALRKRYLRPCREQLHKQHWVPIFERPSIDGRIPGIATGYLLFSVAAALSALSLKYDEGFWSDIADEVNRCIGTLDGPDSAQRPAT